MVTLISIEIQGAVASVIKETAKMKTIEWLHNYLIVIIVMGLVTRIICSQ